MWSRTGGSREYGIARGRHLAEGQACGHIGHIRHDHAGQVVYRLSLLRAEIGLIVGPVGAERLDMIQGEVGSRTRRHLLAAAELHRRESETMGTAHDQMPWGNVRGEELLKRLERANREHLAKVITQCKEHIAQAMGEIAEAREAEGA